MQVAQDPNREKVIGERLEALEWALNNVDKIEDRLVRAYVLRLKGLIADGEKQEEAQMAMGREAIPALIEV